MSFLSLLDKLFDQPLLCPCCLQSARQGLLCSVCATYLIPINNPCPCCARPDSAFERCGQCQQKPPPWDDIQIGWEFSSTCRFLVHQFKYHSDFSAGRALSQQWLQAVQLNELPDQLIATPMFHRKQATKGFNQSELITRHISQALDIPIWQGLKRARATPSLEGLSKKERQQAVKGAFKLSDQPAKRVALIDDVYTSGATAAEITRLLKKHGCEHVSFWALARTPLSP